MDFNHLINGPKKDLIDFIKRRGESSVDEATTELALAKTTIRQHLISLEQQGLIERKFRNVGLGRPQLVYRLTIHGQRLYPTHEPQLLRELLAQLIDSGRQNWVTKFFENYWALRQKEFVKILASLGKKDSLGTRLTALRILLESEGFMPQVETHSGKKATVRECNCPFSEAIKATKIPCKLESEFIKWALKIGMERTSFIPDGDSACVYTQSSGKQSTR